MSHPKGNGAEGVNRRILKLAIPNILSNLSVPMLGAVDTALMGHTDSAVYLGAIALGTVLFNIIYWGFGFLRMGTTGMTAQAYGAGNDKLAALIFGRALLTGLVGAFLILLLQGPISKLGFSMIKGDSETLELARSYFSIRIWAAPATLALYAFHGWFLGMQNARFPMVLTIVVNLFNVGFNFLFVFRYGMLSDGVAYGTVCAQYLGLLAALGLFWHSYRAKLTGLDFVKVFQLNELLRFFQVNADIFIRTICLVSVFTIFTTASSALDAATLAANQVLIQCFYIMSYGVDGFAFAAESLVGRFVGAGNQAQLRQTLRYLFFWGIGLALLFGGGFLLLGDLLLPIFTSLPEVLAVANHYLLWMVTVSVAGAAAFMWDGAYIGATASAAMRNTMLFSTLLIFAPIYLLLFDRMGNDALWLGMLLFMLARSVSMTVLAKREILDRAKRMNRSQETQSS